MELNTLNEPGHEKLGFGPMQKQLRRSVSVTRISFAVTVKLISTFVFARRIWQFIYFVNPNFQPIAIFCACTARFVSDLFGNHIVGFLMMRLKCTLLQNQSSREPYSITPCSLDQCWNPQCKYPGRLLTFLRNFMYQ